MRNIYNAVVLCSATVLLSGTMSAAAFSFTGNFGTDDQIQVFSFVAGPGSATLRTWGFAGTGAGTNANGQTITAGGFDPILSLFGPDSTLQASTPLLATNDNGDGSVPADPSSSNHFDSFIDTASAPTIVTLIPGSTYFLVLTESDNSPISNTFGGGFSEQGLGNFTATLYGCGAPFCDIDPQQRNSAWAVDIVGVASAQNLSVPEPGSLWLLSCAGALALSVRRKFSAARRAS